MNKLLSEQNGGIGLEWDDLRYMDAGNREALKGLANMLADNVILKGVELVQVGATTNYNWTEGYVALGGEICTVDASAAPIDITALPFLYLELDISYPAEGLEDMENLAQDSFYEQRKAKIIGYASAQAGKVLYVTVKTAGYHMGELVRVLALEWTKCQSWKQGSDIEVTANVAVLSIESDNSANAYNLDISAFDSDTPLLRFTSAMPDGTWLALHFIRSGGATEIILGDGTGGNYGFDTAGKSYVFKAGETAVFVWMDEKPRLVNGVHIYEVWHEVGAVDEPAFEAGWSGTLLDVKFRINNEGEVEVIGAAQNASYTSNVSTLVFTLPEDYRPTQKRTINSWDFTNNQMARIEIETDGSVKFTSAGLAAQAIVVNFDGVSHFSTK